jgi:Protein of unknown function (DUF2924)
MATQFEAAPAKGRARPERALRNPAAVETEIAKLADLDLEGIRTRWREYFGSDPPSGLRRDFLCRALAHDIQIKVLGGHDRAKARLLERLAAGDADAIAPPSDAQPRLKPGTLLVREWQGTLHRVMVLDAGFAWSGRTYTSLSAVAGAIAGLKWNGPVFFGLTSKKAKPRPSEQSHG